MSDFNNRDASQKVNPNGDGPVRQEKGPFQRNRPYELSPYPVCASCSLKVLCGVSWSLIITPQYELSSYRKPLELERGYHQYLLPFSQYAPPDSSPQQYPPRYRSSQYPTPQHLPLPNMAAITAHQGQGLYHLLPPPRTFRRHAQASAQAPHGFYKAAAPRQRTAIACRHCRRRKVRENLATNPRSNCALITLT